MHEENLQQQWLCNTAYQSRHADPGARFSKAREFKLFDPEGKF